MGVASSYFTLLRLEATGQARPIEQPSAQQWLIQQLLHPLRGDGLDTDLWTDDLIQTQLFKHYGQEFADAALAELCLRCYISHQVVNTCNRLVQQFGTTYRFQLSDLLPLVLDDNGRTNPGTTLAQKVLSSFKPGAGSLKNWITRLVRQHPDINCILLEHGLYLVSDWAILNDTTPEQLRRILTQFYQLSPIEVEQSSQLLECYRAVYLPDRLRIRSHRCIPPTPEQLQQIGDRLSQLTGRPTSSSILRSLETLAAKLRQYRIARRGGGMRHQSIDRPELAPKIERRMIQAVDELDSLQSHFLQQYRKQFITALDHALAQVIQARHRKVRPAERAEHYLAGLQLVYCQQIAMAEIARRFGMRAQDSVVILLKLSALRADVRHQMLAILKQQVQALAQEFTEVSRLEALSDRIEQVLDDQLAQFMEAEEKHFRKPKAYVEKSLLADRICAYLDQLEIPISLIPAEREVHEHSVHTSLSQIALTNSPDC